MNGMKGRGGIHGEADGCSKGDGDGDPLVDAAATQTHNIDVGRSRGCQGCLGGWIVLEKGVEDPSIFLQGPALLPCCSCCIQSGTAHYAGSIHSEDDGDEDAVGDGEGLSAVGVATRSIA